MIRVRDQRSGIAMRRPDRLWLVVREEGGDSGGLRVRVRRGEVKQESRGN